VVPSENEDCRRRGEGGKAKVSERAAMKERRGGERKARPKTRLTLGVRDNQRQR